jgi:chitinase
MLNYAFFVPLPDGSIAGIDSSGDRLYLGGPGEGALVAFAHRHGVKILCSIGGWTDSDNFPAIAANAELRAAFAHACAELIRNKGFDGIDVDWEYPGYAEHRGTPADRENFTRLLSALKDTLTLLGKSTGKDLLLTAALPAGGTHVKNIDVPEVAQILDRLNLMTYDFHGPWDPLANHNAPLYPSADSDPNRCVDASVRLYCDTLGVPRSRVNVGIPFYGKAFAGCRALNAGHTGEATSLFNGSGPFYYDLSPLPRQFARIWDQRARVPYLVDSVGKVLISYDDEESVRAKGEYIRDHGLRGAVIWEITGDFLPDGRSPLLDALYTSLHTLSRTAR